ncbi:CYTH and CHAD domain-containing protein [Psychrobacter lutiphocae]|uniref:CYTH and CHAD domain-containing protein n=1 Tax=Psychrobacter lutiphocae TaxID=540500 RepID=UPI00036CE410|nr:CYTH and CHAD domain-containing protein [Psychrobacter lutiphocae]
MQEIELKFLVPEYKVASLMRQAKIKSSTTFQLAAHYFDTPDNTLASSGMALRIRKEGDAWVQTLKSNGDGMASRGEQNNVLSEDAAALAQQQQLAPDLSVYKSIDLAGLIANAQASSPAVNLTDGSAVSTANTLKIANEKLSCQYVTDIQRTTRLIKKDNNIIEMAYDEGLIIHGKNPQITQPIIELELELLQGDVAFLFETAKIWCKRYQLCLSTVTKAERGGLLVANKDHTDATKANLKNLAVSKKMSQPQFLRAVVHNCMLQILPNVSAIASSNYDESHVHQLRVGIRRLRTALTAFASFSSQINPEWIPILKQTFSLLGEYRDYQLLQSQTQPKLKSMGGPVVNWQQPADNCGAKRIIEPIAAIRANDFQLTLLELIEFTMSSAKKDNPLNKKNKAATKQDKAKNKTSLKQECSLILDTLYNKIVKASTQFATLDIDSQHKLRKRLKSLRYLTEFVAPLYKKKQVKVFLSSIAPMQDLLGNYNDDLVAHDFYQAKTKEDAKAWFAVGYFTAQNPHSMQACANSLQALQQLPVFWK